MLSRSLLAAACIAALAAPAFADDAGHSGQKAKPAASSPTDKMPEMMTRMHEQIKQIHGTSDPKERERLMAEHMKTMQESMPMMRGMNEGSAMGAQRMDGMSRRMDMMEQMMQQMLEHQKARETAPK
jgi:hypothetical protein